MKWKALVMLSLLSPAAFAEQTINLAAGSCERFCSASNPCDGTEQSNLQMHRHEWGLSDAAAKGRFMEWYAEIRQQAERGEPRTWKYYAVENNTLFVLCVAAKAGLTSPTLTLRTPGSTTATEDTVVKTLPPRPAEPEIDTSKISDEDAVFMARLDASQAQNEANTKYTADLAFYELKKKNAEKEAPGKKINDGKAPYVKDCIEFKNWGSGVSADVKEVLNRCSYPVAVTYCFRNPADINGCNKSPGWGTSNPIPAKGKALAVSGIDGHWVVEYHECKMTDSTKPFCLRP
ncbi:hypothetical protein [Ectopseudomonas mendocina]|uniref:hypothetical protein n=1 Tax=Ectopseudomonas mendocina TaxID=300 RepID=UPI0011D1AE0A|nr:hypothetical protein [Pseudomonas mendocina]